MRMWFNSRTVSVLRYCQFTLHGDRSRVLSSHIDMTFGLRNAHVNKLLELRDLCVAMIVFNLRNVARACETRWVNKVSSSFRIRKIFDQNAVDVCLNQWINCWMCLKYELDVYGKIDKDFIAQRVDRCISEKCLIPRIETKPSLLVTTIDRVRYPDNCDQLWHSTHLTLGHVV